MCTNYLRNRILSPKMFESKFLSTSNIKERILQIRIMPVKQKVQFSSGIFKFFCEQET